jgi:membrane protein implicated in regulation of membrane protease activity
MDEAVIGRTGTVVVRVRGAEGPGEVTVSVRGGSETFLAYADAPLDVGAAVLVVESRGPRAVTVEPWG